MKAIEQIKQHIENKKSFVLEAGAGSGKTYTLIETLNFLIQEKGKELENNNKKIICITYTNVAKNEIIKRLENNPLVLVSTIHEFLWSCIKSFQKQLKIELCKLNELRLNEEEQKKAELTGAKLRDFKHKYIPNFLYKWLKFFLIHKGIFKMPIAHSESSVPPIEVPGL